MSSPPLDDVAAWLDAARGALRAAGRAGAELYLHADEEVAVDHAPGTGAVVARRGTLVRAVARAWGDDGCALVAAVVERAADLVGVVRAARGARPLLPPGEPPAPLGDGGVPDVAPGPASPADARADALGLARRLGAGRLGPDVVLVKRFRSWTAVASSAGVATAEWLTTRQAVVRCETPAGAVVDAAAAPAHDAPWDADGLAARLADAAEVVDAPAGPPDRALPVALRPAVAAPLVAGLGWLLRADTAARSRALERAPGRRVFPAALSVGDDPLDARGAVWRAFDDEGRAALPQLLVDAGRLRSFLGARGGPGRARRAAAWDPPAPAAFNLCVAPGDGALPPDRTELTARFETLTTMPRGGLVTVVAAGWELRDGERVRRVGPVDLDLPVLRTLRTLVAVGDDVALLPASEGVGTPTLVLAAPAQSR